MSCGSERVKSLTQSFLVISFSYFHEGSFKLSPNNKNLHSCGADYVGCGLDYIRAGNGGGRGVGGAILRCQHRHEANGMFCACGGCVCLPSCKNSVAPKPGDKKRDFLHPAQF